LSCKSSSCCWIMSFFCCFRSATMESFSVNRRSRSCDCCLDCSNSLLNLSISCLDPSRSVFRASCYAKEESVRLQSIVVWKCKTNMKKSSPTKYERAKRTSVTMRQKWMLP
jgi:hypothetical protein